MVAEQTNGTTSRPVSWAGAGLVRVVRIPATLVRGDPAPGVPLRGAAFSGTALGRGEAVEVQDVRTDLRRCVRRRPCEPDTGPAGGRLLPARRPRRPSCRCPTRRPRDIQARSLGRLSGDKPRERRRRRRRRRSRPRRAPRGGLGEDDEPRRRGWVRRERLASGCPHAVEDVSRTALDASGFVRSASVARVGAFRPPSSSDVSARGRCLLASRPVLGCVRRRWACTGEPSKEPGFRPGVRAAPRSLRGRTRCFDDRVDGR